MHPLGLLLPLVLPASAWPHQSFVTEEFQPVQLSVNKTGSTANGYLIFAAEDESPAASTPLIMSDDGELVWQSGFHPPGGSEGHLFMNADIQQLDGQTFFTYYNGTPSGSHSYGSVHILDHSYQEKYNVCLKPDNFVPSTSVPLDCLSDFHESQITGRGTILLSAYNVSQGDLSSVGGPKNGWILESQFYEVDIKTNEIKFAWKPLEHTDKLPVSMSHYPLGGAGASKTSPYDYFHLNSVFLLPDGGYLLSSRHLWAVIKLTETGDVEWVLPGDGKGGDFSQIDPKLNFSWQHHARVDQVTADSMTLHIHNNGNSEVQTHHAPTSGLLMQLSLSNAQNRTAALVRNFTDPTDPIFSIAEGSYQALPNGNVLLEYGYSPEIKEFLPNGDVVYRAQFGDRNQVANSYRAYRLPWVGRPKTNPKAKAANGTLYMSWNGATEYDQWMVLSGSSKTNLKFLANVTRSGFESSLPLKGQSGFAQAKAVYKGTVQGQSPIIAI